MTFLPVSLVAVCDIDFANAKATAAQYGAKCYKSTRKMYANEDLDAVFLCTPPQFFPELTCEAFDSHLNV